MPKIEAAFFDVGTFEALALKNTIIHRLDSRAKLITTLVFIFTVVSHGKYEVSGLLLFFLFPVSIGILGNLPFSYLFKKLLLVAPFALLIGIFNPILDREVLIHLGPIGISGGWISFFSIMLRFCLTVGAAFILIATTGFHDLCLALIRLGTPKAFAVQLLFLYRYLFVLVDEAARLVRARSLRSFNGKGIGIKETGSLIGHLLLRTLGRARRVYLAMLCRGFVGEFRILHAQAIRQRDILYTLGCSTAFVCMRLYNLPQLLGKLILGK